MEQPSPANQERPAAQVVTTITIWSWLRNLWDSIRQTVFILGLALVVFACARNTITWCANRLWGASGSFWQSQWENVYDFFEGDPMYISIIGSKIVTEISFWGFNAFFLTLDLMGKPASLLKYKINPNENFPIDIYAIFGINSRPFFEYRVDWNKFKKALKLCVFNQSVVAFGVTWCAAYAFQWRGCSYSRELPYFHWVLFEIAVFSLVEEFFFYYSHRIMHHRLLYKHFHKIHHEWTSPIGIRSVYAHPVEHVICNLIPPLMGPFLMGSHVATSWLWFCLALFTTTISHCGYHFPFLPSPEAHDFHHQKFMNNFGAMGILDRLHGTDLLFRQSKSFERHYVLTTLTPVRELHPDDPKDRRGKLQKAQ